jgi:GH35 family endo-1,4-beta-xylanase
MPFNDYKNALENRIKQIAERYGDTICEFEVMNEIFQKKEWETPLRKDVVWSFKTARKYLKNNKLIINDGQNVWDDFANGNLQYFNLIKQSLDSGAPIDSIGVQSHIMWCSKTSLYPENLWGFYEKYAELNLPFSITEVTIPSILNGTQDEAAQAEFLKCLYSLWFGVKGMESIIYWNLINGYAHGATPGDMTVGENVYSGGLLNFDTSKRPSYHALNELINKEWKTNLELGSNDFGIVNFNGFFGKYEISTFINGKKERAIVDLTRQNNLQEIYLK